jgi:K+-sensing histidine kinase KdpD
MIAHELRSPLAVIQGYSHLLESELPPETTGELRGYLATIKAHANMLNHLIDGLVLVDQAAEGYWPRALAICELDRLADLSIADVSELAVEKEIALHFEPPAGSFWVEADERAVRLALYHLLWHGIRHARPGSELTLAAVSTREYAGFRLCDLHCREDEFSEPVFVLTGSASERAGETSVVSDLSLLVAGVVATAHHGQLEVLREPGGRLMLAFYLSPPPE